VSKIYYHRMCWTLLWDTSNESESKPVLTFWCDSMKIWPHIVTNLVVKCSNLVAGRMWSLEPRPHVGSGVKRIDLISLLARCHKRRLNQALSVLCLILCFFSVCFVSLVPLCVTYILCYFCVLSYSAVLVRLSVSVKMIDWKDSSLKWPTMCW